MTSNYTSKKQKIKIHKEDYNDFIIYYSVINKNPASYEAQILMPKIPTNSRSIYCERIFSCKNLQQSPNSIYNKILYTGIKIEKIENIKDKSVINYILAYTDLSEVFSNKYNCHLKYQINKLSVGYEITVPLCIEMLPTGDFSDSNMSYNVTDEDTSFPISDVISFIPIIFPPTEFKSINASHKENYNSPESYNPGANFKYNLVENVYNSNDNNLKTLNYL